MTMHTVMVIVLGLCFIVGVWAFLRYVVLGAPSSLDDDNDDDFNSVVGMGMMGGVAVGMAAAAAGAAAVVVAEEEIDDDVPVEDDDDLPIIGSPIMPTTGEDVSAEGLVAEEPMVLSPDEVDPPYPTGTQIVSPEPVMLDFPAEGQMLPGAAPEEDHPEPAMGTNDPDELPSHPPYGAMPPPGVRYPPGTMVGDPEPTPIAAFPLRMPLSPPAPPSAPDPEPDNSSNQGDTSDSGSNDDE